MLFAVASENQANIFSVVARDLIARGHVPRFLTFDRYYAQHAGRGLAANGFDGMVLQSLSCHGEWCAYEEKDVGKFVLEAAPQIAKCLVKVNPDCVVLSNDIGPLEQITLRRAESLGIRTVRIQDGLQTINDSRKAWTYRQAVMGEGSCDLNCVWSDSTADDLLEKGVGSTIAVTGNPNYDRLFQQNRKERPFPPFVVLVANQCMARYGEMSAAQEIALYQRVIGQLLQRPDVKVLFKLHPQTDLGDAYQRLVSDMGERVELCTVDDSLEALSQAHALVTFGSTMALEAVLLGLPTAILDYVRFRATDFLREEMVFLEQLHSREFPATLGGPPKLKWFGWFHHNPVDGISTARVNDTLIKMLKDGESEEKRPTEDSVSVITTFNKTDPLNCIQSMLKQGEFLKEIILVDRSEDGALKTALSEILANPKVCLLHAPGANISTALNRALELVTGETVMRIDSDATACHGLLSNAASALKTECGAVFPGFLLRNEFGIFSKACALLEKFHQKDLLEGTLMRVGVQCYAFRRSPDLRYEESTIGTDFHFLSKIAGSFPGSYPFKSIHVPLYMTVSRTEITLSLLEEKRERQIQADSPVNEDLSLSVIYTALRERERILEFLKAAAGQSLDRKQLEVIVLVDETLARDRFLSKGDYPFSLKIVEVPPHLKRESRNIGLSSSSNDICLFFSEYLTPDTHCFRAHLDFHRQQQAKILTGVNLFREPFDRTILALVFAKSELWPIFSRNAGSRLGQVVVPFSSNMSLRREMLNSIPLMSNPDLGLADEEDIAAGYRLWEKGYAIERSSDARAYSEKGVTLRHYFDAVQNIAFKSIHCACVQGSPKALMALLGIQSVTSQVVREWQDAVELAPMLETLLQQLSSIENTIPSFETEEAVRSVNILIEDILAALQVASDQLRVRSFSQYLSETGTTMGQFKG